MGSTMRVSDVLKSGFPLTVELLTEVPASNDPLTWSRVPLLNAQTVTGVPTIQNTSDNLLCEMDVYFDVEVAFASTCNCVGITWQGNCIAVAVATPQYLAGRMQFGLNLQFQVGPWEQ